MKAKDAKVLTDEKLEKVSGGDVTSGNIAGNAVPLKSGGIYRNKVEAAKILTEPITGYNTGNCAGNIEKPGNKTAKDVRTALKSKELSES